MTHNVLADVLITVVTLLLSICVHEFAHAFAAYKLGDDYAARMGRLTLNPFAHADPLGTLILPAVFTLMGGGVFGWGKPVPYVPTNLTRRFSMRAGEAIIAFAGPLANLLMAIFCGGLLVATVRFGVIGASSPFYPLLRTMLYLNVVLFFFNLLPVPPLDGSKIFAWMLGQRADGFLDAIQRAGPMALMIVIIAGGSVISYPVHLVVGAIITGFGTMLG